MYTVGQFARICNVSTKTLRHYDEIGLFGPAMVGPDNQYRYYSRGAATRLPGCMRKSTSHRPKLKFKKP